jgi:hypothetical protein
MALRGGNRNTSGCRQAGNRGTSACRQACENVTIVTVSGSARTADVVAEIAQAEEKEAVGRTKRDKITDKPQKSHLN